MPHLSQDLDLTCSDGSVAPATVMNGPSDMQRAWDRGVQVSGHPAGDGPAVAYTWSEACPGGYDQVRTGTRPYRMRPGDPLTDDIQKLELSLR